MAKHKPAYKPAKTPADEIDAVEPGVVKATVYMDLANVTQHGMPLELPIRLRIDAGHPGSRMFQATVIVEE